MEVFSYPHQRDPHETQDFVPSAPRMLEKVYEQFRGTPYIFRAGDGSKVTCLTVLHQNKNRVVRLVDHEGFDKPLIGKFYNGDVSVPEEIQRFRNEAEILSMLAGKDVPDVRGWGEQEGKPYVLMDFIPGVSLQAMIDASEGRPLPLRIVKRIGVQLASILASIHEAGVVHRDVKPGNVILRDDGGVSVIDFGLACRRRGQDLRLTHEGQTMGTPRYLAPESILAGSRNSSPASDMYGLGLTLAELAMGRHPLSDDQIYALTSGRIPFVDYSAMCVQATQEIKNQDELLGGLIGRMLGDLDTRPTAAELVEALTGMTLEQYRTQPSKRHTIPWKIPCHPEAPRRGLEGSSKNSPSLFGETEKEAAHAMLKAIQDIATRSRRRFIATISGASIVLGVAGIGVAVGFLNREEKVEDPRLPFDPFGHVGKRPEEGVALSMNNGEPCVWVFRISPQELQRLGIEINGQNAIPCTLFYRENTSFLFVPGKGIHRLGETSEEDVRRFIDSLPALDGPVTIPSGFPGNENSWRSTVNGRLQVLRGEVRSGVSK